MHGTYVHIKWQCVELSIVSLSQLKFFHDNTTAALCGKFFPLFWYEILHYEQDNCTYYVQNILRNIFGNFDNLWAWCCHGNQLKWHNGVRFVDEVVLYTKCTLYTYINSRNQKGITNSWDVSFKKRLPCQTTHNKTKPPPRYICIYVCLPSSSSTKKALKMCRRFFYSDATLGQSWKRGGSILAIISGFG